MTPDDTTPFRVSLTQDDAVPSRRLIHVAGSLDHVTPPGERAGLVRTVLEAAGEPGTTAMVMDLRSVTYVDSAGLSVVVKLWRQLRGQDISLAILAPGPVREVLDLTGITEHIPVVATLRELDEPS